MKNIILILLTIHISLFTIHSQAQPCLPNGITFSTQEQIDNFQINYPNCTEINGVVSIKGEDITNLDGLSVLTSISGSLHIGRNPYGGNPSLINLSGLANLTYIQYDFEIYENDALISLAGLESIHTILGNLSIENNDALTNLSGLINVSSITGWSYLSSNIALTNLSGLDNLNSVGGRLFISTHG